MRYGKPNRHYCYHKATVAWGGHAFGQQYLIFQAEATGGMSRKVLHGLLQRPGLVVAIGCMGLTKRWFPILAPAELCPERSLKSFLPFQRKRPPTSD